MKYRRNQNQQRWLNEEGKGIFSHELGQKRKLFCELGSELINKRGFLLRKIGKPQVGYKQWG
ncbi:MAG: hypothetical protein CM15mV109_500 [uncultured marine virus]|nr:MAG: hypothetical protein CM15mV109_500 [uncultured marine virus]